MAAALTEAASEEDTEAASAAEALEADATEASEDLTIITDPSAIGVQDPSLEAGITVPITTEEEAVLEDFWESCCFLSYSCLSCRSCL